ncbi:MAG: DNA-binding protein [Planctomycetales bacterium]|nr:DNA-binding protein [Planctomycetales bacterium]
MATTDPVGQFVVCDAGPLIHLDELRCLDLLAEFETVLVPSAVWIEVARHRPAVLVSPGVPLRRVTVSLPWTPALEVLSQALSLHLGEMEALQVACEQQVGLLLTDDTAARLAARNLGLLVHGTLGLLIRAVRRGQRSRDQVLSVLRSVPDQSTLHIKSDLLDEIIRQVTESTR